MKYDYQYSLCAIAVNIMIMIIYHIRSRYLSRTNKIYLSLVICDCLAAIFDVISTFTITYIEIVPTWISVLCSFFYFLFYNHMSLFFFVYIWKKSGITKYDKIFGYFCKICSVFYIIMLSTTQWTHAVFYYENNQYKHGPFMTVFFILPFIVLVLEITLFIKARNNFTKHQWIGSIILIVLMILLVGLTVIFPRVLIGEFAMSIIMFFIYITYENPGYYTYLDTFCLNRNAFMEDFEHQKKNRMVVFYCEEYELLGQQLDFHSLEFYQKKIAEQLGEIFGKDIFNIRDDRYVLLLDDDSQLDFSEIVAKINASVDAYNLNVKIIWINEIQGFSAHDIELLAYNVEKDIHSAAEIRTEVELLNQQITSSNQLLKCIVKAIENESFEVYYQPIFNVKTRRFDSAEALIRLIDPELGFINPEQMIMLAEKHGYINIIGDIVFEKVCKFYSQNNLSELGIQYIEVNFSPLQCIRKDLVPVCLKIMEKYDVKPQNINIEITETADYQNDKIVIDTFEEFAKLGFHISLDDYGSGYASPNYIISFPMNYIKIDKLILWEAMKQENAMKIFENIVRMIQSIGKKVIVEGAENDEMIRILEDLKCDYIQGYYYSKPLPENDYLNFIKS